MSGIEIYNDLFQIQIQFRLFKNFGFVSRKSSGFGSRKSSDIINQKEEESNCYQFKKKHSTVFSLQLRQKRSKILIRCLCIYLGFFIFNFCLDPDPKQINSRSGSRKKFWIRIHNTGWKMHGHHGIFSLKGRAFKFLLKLKGQHDDVSLSLNRFLNRAFRLGKSFKNDMEFMEIKKKEIVGDFCLFGTKNMQLGEDWFYFKLYRTVI